MHHPNVFLGIVIDIGLKIIQEIHVPVFFQAIAQHAFLELLFTLGTYPYGKFQCFLVLLAFRRSTGLFYQIQTEVFFSPVMLDGELRLSQHLTAFIIHLITVFIQHGLFLSTQIILQI